MDVRYVDVRALTTRMNDRRDSQSKDVLSFGPFSLFAAERLLKKADEPIPLGNRALDVLIALAEQAGEVVTHKELISSVWRDVTVEDANSAFTSRPFGRRLATDEMALAMCRMLLVVGIVSSLRSHARALSKRFRSLGPPPQNEFKSCRRD